MFRWILLTIMAVGGAWIVWYTINCQKTTIEHLPASSMDRKILEIEAEKKHEVSNLAKKYIDGVPDGVVLLNDMESSTQREIEYWEGQISDFAITRQQKPSDLKGLRSMANQTASLFRLLNEASSRQKSGLDPYTPLSGFNTMTLVMSMEKLFKDEFDFTFSEFMLSQDTGRLKALIQN